ncbi:TPA: hypothetical protein VB230_001160 [Streptococcus pyogenes]|uniref:hypothetical protein n=1 Tax=Streptococcus pyogenes TaxID=1314 RepID=UPI0001E107CC|nr:hypothetical protein [Streptococcus pyogenes]EFM32707.1 hypothetical protein HMPREF0841_1686 [Streptococcus pyogenes ATCC 10782]SQE37861.1 Uncharacterised protein [Streptococcus pyogenes]SQF43793.1 Uncharacterised protein [Streptococcus pyogenes]SQF58591.1 Uncharacterised protein [Streptococcus pyogenes]SUO51241.1 Uncharacterised protein [Streptococcus pyogenes]
MSQDYINEKDVIVIKKELLQVLRKYKLNSGLSVVILDETKEDILKYSTIPE